jgi:hypothetical protein
LQEARPKQDPSHPPPKSRLPDIQTITVQPQLNSSSPLSSPVTPMEGNAKQLEQENADLLDELLGMEQQVR